MTQIMLPAVFCRKDFDNILRSMSDDDAATFAATNRTTFASCFTLAAPGSVAPSEPAKPALAKTKAPASTTPKPRERAISLSPEEHEAARAIVDCVNHNAGIRSRDIGTLLDGRSKSRVLAWLVTAKMLSVQGKAAGARYYPVNGTPETGAAPEQAE
jgi:hypothetical protein